MNYYVNLGAFLLLLPLWTTWALYGNYRLTKSTGLPILLSPVDPINPFWVLLRPYVNPLFSRLPLKLGYFTQYNKLGWEWHDKNRLHTTHGSVFVIVTPTRNHLIIADKDACEYVFKHLREWPMNPAFSAPLEIFGSNVGTADGHAWQRQRKITNVAFNEKNSTLVWNEATKQAEQMLHSWVQAPNVVTSTVQDVNLLALHVLAGAGFGMSFDFDSPLTAVSPGHTMSYRDALQALMDNIVLAYFVSMLKLPLLLLPDAMRRVAIGIDEFKQYTADMVKTEREAYVPGSKSSARVNLLSSIVRASIEAENSKEGGEPGMLTRGSLSNEELLGNLYAFNVAGQDITASTITYATAMLACNPECQRWVREEIDSVCGTKRIRDFQYEQVFPRLVRYQAIMYETLRLFPPLPSVPRYTGESYSHLPLGSKMHAIPPHTAVWGNVAAVQTDEQYWGDDATVWRPNRWIRHGGVGDGEELIETVEHSYIPWASGPRVCPGKKFAQVEIVAVIASMMQSHVVAPVLDGGETEAAARERIARVVATRT
ncbi:hypothetical protein H2200_011322 [Cladophialophora chaetospira]|uniref:Cytochrome P450 n=1 Tax=Cladophialophora chaetospira TaxID=386627 RepID=A0AA38X0D8_9EURO|nr:hypothetical protein H2200_011322 [Cladophialophora chaetospira]